jgi:hypothetical protein
VTALDCKLYLSKKQHLIIAFGKLSPHGYKQIITYRPVHKTTLTNEDKPTTV